MAVDNGYLPHNIVRDVKRDKSQVPGNRFRTHVEIQKMIAEGNYSSQEVKEITRYQYLSLEEVEEFVSLAKDHWLHPILATFAYSGMRRGELAKLEWADVDLEKRYLYIRSYKQSKTRQETVRNIPIQDKLLPILLAQKLKTGSKRWVFVCAKGSNFTEDSLSKGLRKFIKRTKYEGLGFHVFRHSLASNLAAQGVDQRIIDKILGHQTEAMKQRYQHLFPEQMEMAMKKLQIL
jgi:integrase